MISSVSGSSSMISSSSGSIISSASGSSSMISSSSDSIISSASGSSSIVSSVPPYIAIISSGDISTVSSRFIGNVSSRFTVVSGLDFSFFILSSSKSESTLTSFTASSAFFCARFCSTFCTRLKSTTSSISSIASFKSDKSSSFFSASSSELSLEPLSEPSMCNKAFNASSKRIVLPIFFFSGCFSSTSDSVSTSTESSFEASTCSFTSSEDSVFSAISSSSCSSFSSNVSCSAVSVSAAFLIASVNESIEVGSKESASPKISAFAFARTSAFTTSSSTNLFAKVSSTTGILISGSLSADLSDSAFSAVLAASSSVCSCVDETGFAATLTPFSSTLFKSGNSSVVVPGFSYLLLYFSCCDGVSGL